MSTDSAARLLNEGWALQQRGSNEAALKKYQAVLKEASDEKAIPMLACLNMGNIAHNAEDHALALHWYCRAAEIDPSSDAPYYNMANVYRETKKYDEAIMNYTLATGKNSRDAGCRRNLALTYAAVGRNREAVEQLRACIDISPGDDPVDYLNLGRLQAATGNELGAINSLDTFLKTARREHRDHVSEAKQLQDSLKRRMG